MDTSETYVKMCEKAEEIQLANLDLKINKYLHQSSVVNGICIVMGDFFYLPGIYTQWFDKDAIWLPRQDQLQEMIEKKNTRELLMRFTDWVEKETNYRRESMEQLWLAFVMQERFNKHWTGTEWADDTRKKPEDSP